MTLCAVLNPQLPLNVVSIFDTIANRSLFSWQGLLYRTFVFFANYFVWTIFGVHGYAIVAEFLIGNMTLSSFYLVFHQ